MAGSVDVARLTLVVHYAAPFILLGYFSVTSLWSLIMLQTDCSLVRKRLKRVILILMSSVCLAFLIEAIVIISQIFAHGGKFATQDYNVYALSLALVWLVLTGCALRSNKHRWYPYYGVWGLSLAIDGFNTFMGVLQGGPHTPSEWVQVAIQAYRVTATMFLLVIVISTRRSTYSGPDEETTPLLAKSAQGNGSATTDLGHSVESEVRNRIDHETQRKQKERDRKMNSMQEKLREDGNWFTYARRFLIFWPYLWPTKRPRLLVNMAGVASCLVAERILNIMVPNQLRALVNSLTAGIVGPSFGALALYILFSWLNSYSAIRGLRSVLWVPVESNARACLDTKSYDHIMELSCDFHDDKQDGELFAAMRQGVSIVNLLETLLYDLAPMVADLVLALAYFWILFDSYLVLIAATTMVVYFWVTLYITNYQVQLQRTMNAMYRQKFGFLHDTMSQWRTVVYFNRILHVERLFASTVSVFNSMWRKVRYINHAAEGAQSLVLDLGSFATFGFAVYQVIYKGKDLGSFMALLTFWERFTGPLMFLSGTHREVLHNLVDAEELRNLFERNPSVPDGPNEMNMDQAEVTFDNVSFSYNGNGANITNLSMHVAPGKTIALVGETGAGKSTLLKLLFRFYDVESGSIQIDGQDIRDVTLESLRENIGVVPQEPNLFNDTIMANLRFGKLDITTEEAIEACKAAAIHDQIEKFPNGYDSIIGERGVKLSGGERQRVAIARTMLKNPKLILLDEATSSVDNETEEKIQAGLARLCAGRTTIVIAHRLSTIMDADLIVVIKDGAILEKGSPGELLKRKGKYYSLWSKQMGIIDTLSKQDQIHNIVEVSSTTPGTSISELTHESSDTLSEENDSASPPKIV